MAIIGNIEQSDAFMQKMVAGLMLVPQDGDPLPLTAGTVDPHLYADLTTAKLHFVDALGADHIFTVAISFADVNAALAAASAAVNINSQKLQAVADGTLATDAATYGQVPAVAAAAAVTSTHAGAGNAAKLLKLDANGKADGVSLTAITGKALDSTSLFIIDTIAGADASGGAVQTTLTGTAVGDKVLAVIGLDGTGIGVNESSHFEATIAHAGKIVQADTDLSATTALLVMVLKKG